MLLCLLVLAYDASAEEPDVSSTREATESGDNELGPMWMRSLRLDGVRTEARPEEQLRSSLIAAEPRFRPCSEFMPEAPASEELLVRYGMTLWEEGTVRSVRLIEPGPEGLERATKCLMDALQSVRFPADPGLSDDRRLKVDFRARWVEARLDLIVVSEEVRVKLDVPDPTVEGQVDLISIGARIDSIAPRLSRCLRVARKRNPEMGRRLTVRLRLAQDREHPGRSEASLEQISVVDSDLGDEDAEVCIIRELERLSWPRPFTRVARVEWPFLFEE